MADKMGSRNAAVFPLPGVGLGWEWGLGSGSVGWELDSLRPAGGDQDSAPSKDAVLQDQQQAPANSSTCQSPVHLPLLTPNAP